MSCCRYGEMFRKIREQKGFSLSHFETLNISKSSIAKFERGETLMAFERVYSMLQMMNVSLSEYELSVNHYCQSYQEFFLVELERAEVLGDNIKLEKLYQESLYSGCTWLIVLAKSKLGVLNKQEKREAINFILSVKLWGYFELALTHSVLDLLTTVELKSLFNVWKNMNKNYFRILKYRRRVFQCAYKAVIILSSRGEKDIVEEILAITDDNHGEELDFFVKVIRQLSIGFTIYSFDSKIKGELIMNKNLILLEELGNKDLRNYYEKKLKIYKRVRSCVI